VKLLPETGDCDERGRSLRSGSGGLEVRLWRSGSGPPEPETGRSFRTSRAAMKSLRFAYTFSRTHHSRYPLGTLHKTLICQTKYKHTHTHTHTHTHAHAHAHTHTYIHVYIYTPLYIHIHTHTHYIHPHLGDPLAAILAKWKHIRGVHHAGRYECI